MTLAELLTLSGALLAPAFFLVFGLACLGAPLLALACLMGAQMGSAMHLEAYARRLLRLALPCAAASLPVLLAALGLFAWRAPWVRDWVLAAPLLPALTGVSLLAYAASLLTLRLSGSARHQRRQHSPLSQASLLALLCLTVLWLVSESLGGLAQQARAVLNAPAEGGLSVAPLLPPEPEHWLAPSWVLLTALAAAGMGAAGAMSLEYLLALRDREPFGHEAQGHMLRLAAGATLRCVLVAGAFLPLLWNRMRLTPEGNATAAALLGACGGACLLLCLCAGIVARSRRPWKRSGVIHAALACLWAALTALLVLGLQLFYWT